MIKRTLRHGAQTLRVALRALNRNKMRSFLTALGIIIGVGAVIAMVSIGEGAKRGIESRFASMGTNLLFVSPGSQNQRGVHGGWGSVTTLKEDDALAIGRECPAVLYISPSVSARADLTPVKVIPARDKHGQSSRVSAVYDAAPRKSFIVALKDVPEAWEVTYDPNAEPVYEGLVHDFQLGEAVPVPGPFPVRRIRLAEPLDDFFFDQSYEHLIGAARGGQSAQVVDLYIRRKIAELALPGMPHLGSGITFEIRAGRCWPHPTSRRAWCRSWT